MRWKRRSLDRELMNSFNRKRWGDGQSSPPRATEVLTLALLSLAFIYHFGLLLPQNSHAAIAFTLLGTLLFIADGLGEAGK